MQTSIEKQEVFLESYLSNLKENAVGFRRVFSVFKWFFVFTTGLQIVVMFFLIAQGGLMSFFGLFQAVILALVIGLLAWFWSLCVKFAGLQISKIEHDLKTQLSFRKEVQRSSSDILEAAKRRAGHMVKSKGDNVVINVGSGSVSDVDQTKQVEGTAEVGEILALILAYTQEVADRDAQTAAEKFAEEATKSEPDKSVLATLWATIAAAIPSILTVVKITEGVKKLF